MLACWLIALIDVFKKFLRLYRHNLIIKMLPKSLNGCRKIRLAYCVNISVLKNCGVFISEKLFIVNISQKLLYDARKRSEPINAMRQQTYKSENKELKIALLRQVKEVPYS